MGASSSVIGRECKDAAGVKPVAVRMARQASRGGAADASSNVMNDDPATPALPERARDWLAQDPLRHVLLLKAWDSYASSITVHHAAIGDDQGLLFVYPTAVSPYESVRYAQTQRIALIDADTPAVAATLAEALPHGETLVLKLVEMRDLPAAEAAFRLQRATNYLSYSPRPGSRFAVSAQVEVSTQLDEALLPLFARSGYIERPVRFLFEKKAAMSFAVRHGGEPVSVCMAHRNCGNVWELGGIYTADSARGQGLGAEVMQTALQTLLDAGCVPRFPMNEKNIVWRRLAESLGLRQTLSTGHLIAIPR